MDQLTQLYKSRAEDLGRQVFILEEKLKYLAEEEKQDQTPKFKFDSNTMDSVRRYNKELNVSYMVVTDKKTKKPIAVLNPDTGAEVPFNTMADGSVVPQPSGVSTLPSGNDPEAAAVKAGEGAAGAKEGLGSLFTLASENPKSSLGLLYTAYSALTPEFNYDPGLKGKSYFSTFQRELAAGAGGAKTATGPLGMKPLSKWKIASPFALINRLRASGELERMNIEAEKAAAAEAAALRQTTAAETAAQAAAANQAAQKLAQQQWQTAKIGAKEAKYARDAAGNLTLPGQTALIQDVETVTGQPLHPKVREQILSGRKPDGSILFSTTESPMAEPTRLQSGARVSGARGGAGAIALEPPQTPDEWLQAFKRGVAPDIEKLEAIGGEVKDVVTKIKGEVPKSSTTRALEAIGVGPGVAGKLPLIGAALSVPEAIEKAEKGDYAGSVGSIVQNFSIPTAWAMQAKEGLEQYAQDTTSLRRSASAKAELPFWMRGGALEQMLGAGQEGSNVRKVVPAGSVSPERAKSSDIVVAGSAGVAPGQLTQTDIASGKGPAAITGDAAKSIEQEIIGPDRPALAAKKAEAEEEKRKRILAMERMGPKL